MSVTVTVQVAVRVADPPAWLTLTTYVPTLLGVIEIVPTFETNQTDADVEVND